VKNALKLKRGVCQDYAHLMIAVCRSVGLPSRYVSGYHFVGDLQGSNANFEQASHAWVETHIPGTGWLGFDPTNNVEVNWRYIKLGHGRDYKDIVPVKGVYRGGAGTLSVKVDVRKLDN
jgi:transglutaminase-like putative cysteine protease